MKSMIISCHLSASSTCGTHQYRKEVVVDTVKHHMQDAVQKLYPNGHYNNVALCVTFSSRVRYISATMPRLTTCRMSTRKVNRNPLIKDTEKILSTTKKHHKYTRVEGSQNQYTLT